MEYLKNGYLKKIPSDLSDMQGFEVKEFEGEFKVDRVNYLEKITYISFAHQTYSVIRY